MGKAGEFGICLADLKKVTLAIVFLKLCSVLMNEKSRCYVKKQRIHIHMQSSQAS